MNKEPQSHLLKSLVPPGTRADEDTSTCCVCRSLYIRSGIPSMARNDKKPFVCGRKEWMFTMLADCVLTFSGYTTNCPITQCHTSMFQGATNQLAVRKWTVLRATCLFLSQIRLRYATGVNGTADRIRSEGPGPSSKASHVLVMSLDHYAGVETVRCASPLWKETAMNHIWWTNGDRKWPACMCFYIHTASTCFGAWLPVSALLSESTGYINSQRQQILYIRNSHDYKLGMKRNNVNHTQVFQSFAWSWEDSCYNLKPPPSCITNHKNI